MHVSLLQTTFAAALAVVIPATGLAPGAAGDTRGQQPGMTAKDISWSVYSHRRNCTRTPRGLRCAGIDARTGKTPTAGQRPGAEAPRPQPAAAAPPGL